MTDFPMDIVIFNKIVEVFNQTRRYVLLLFPLAFFVRIAFGFIFLKPESFTDILKDSLFLFLGLFFFTDILKLTLQIPYFVSSELTLGEWRNINLGDGIFTKALKRIVDWIGIVSYWVSFGLYVVIISILGFFAGYILFFGTMFRAYGLLKVFFILLFVVSLWPLLWHSINFAVYTIAVSDNALANNVIIGGASLAKVFIPLWLISKTSKIPIAQTLKKVSFTGGGLAYSGGSQAYSVLQKQINKNSNNQEIQNELEIGGKETEINISQENLIQDDEAYIDEGEDFSIREEAPSLTNQNKLSIEENNQQSIEQDTSIEQNQENHIQNDINKEVHIENSPQVTKEIKESQSLSETKNQNESILENPNLNPEVSKKEEKTELFNEAIHKEDWVEGEENYIAPRHQKNKAEDIER